MMVAERMVEQEEKYSYKKGCLESAIWMAINSES